MYKRNEAFRFEFNQPLSGTMEVFEHHEVNNNQKFEIKIFDISPRGMKVACSEKIGCQNQEHVSITTVINEGSITMNGELQWQGDSYFQAYLYGVKLIGDKNDEGQIIEELTKYASRVVAENL